MKGGSRLLALLRLRRGWLCLSKVITTNLRLILFLLWVLATVAAVVLSLMVLRMFMLWLDPDPTLAWLVTLGLPLGLLWIFGRIIIWEHVLTEPERKRCLQHWDACIQSCRTPCSILVLSSLSVAIIHFFLQPWLARYYFDQGTGLWSKGKHSEASARFARAIRLHPNYAPYHYGLGRALRELSDRSGALNEYKVACKLDPELHIACNEWAHLLLDDGACSDALEILLNADMVLPENLIRYRLYTNLGRAYICVGHHERAQAALSLARFVQPTYPEAYYYLGLSFELAGDPCEAITCFQSFVRYRVEGQTDPSLSARAEVHLADLVCDPPSQ